MAKLDKQGLNTFIRELDKHINTKINRLDISPKAEKVLMSDGTSVEESVNANKTSILSLQEELGTNKSTLKQILIDKKIEGLENENSLSVLVEKASLLNDYTEKVYIYKDGTFNDSYTKNYNSTYTTLSNNSFTIKGDGVTSTHISFSFNDIDFTEYKTLHIECSLVMGTSYSSENATFNVNLTKGSESVTSPCGSRFNKSLEKGERILDVSTVNGKHYLNITVYHTNFTIYKIWLEK